MALKVFDLAAPPEVLKLEVGDTCRVTAQFDYVGPQITGVVFYAAIGIKGTWFTEKVKGQKTWTVPETSEVKTYTAYADIPITSAISVGAGYDMYAKLINTPGPDIFSEYLLNVIEIVGAPSAPEFSNLQIMGLPKSSWMGGILTFTVMFNYRGPTVTRQLYAAIGNKNTWFNEIITGIKSISISGSTTWATRLATVQIEVKPPITPGVYDIYAKINGEMSPIYENVITITL